MKTLSGLINRFHGIDEVITKTHRPHNRTSIYQEDTKPLAAEGYGTIGLTLKKYQAFNLDLIASNAMLRLSVSQQAIRLYCIYRGRFILLKENRSMKIGLDSGLQCWLSFQANKRTVLFGKNEPIFQNTVLAFTLPKSNKSPEQYWMNKIRHYRIDTPAMTYLSKTVVKPTSSKRRINLLHPRL